jgi:hypothetical protein
VSPPNAASPNMTPAAKIIEPVSGTPRCISSPGTGVYGLFCEVASLNLVDNSSRKSKGPNSDSPG